jgi:hypothetical protein
MHTIAPLKKVAKFYEEERLVRSRKELGTIHKRRCADIEVLGRDNERSRWEKRISIQIID